MINIEEKYSKNNLDTKWDNQKISYDLEKFPWPSMFEAVIRERYPQVKDLTLLHEYLDSSQLIEIRKYLESFTRSTSFRQLVDQFASHVLEKKGYEYEEYMLQLTPGLRIVVPNQLHKNRLLNFHTGYWTGYDNGTNTIWIPLTPAYDTNTLWVTDWDTSHKLMKKIHNESWPLGKIQQECERVSWPVEVAVGESWLFNQGHLHGNVNNTTGKTRLSFDFRVAHKNIEFGRRRPGSYYRFPGTEIQFPRHRIDKDKNWIAFTSPNDEYIDMAPYFMIREYLLGWCKTVDIAPNEWSNEYHECKWMPKFVDFINKKNTGIVFASIYNFSLDIEERIEYFKTAIKNNCQLIFVDENILVDKEEDLELIKKYYQYYY